MIEDEDLPGLRKMLSNIQLNPQEGRNVSWRKRAHADYLNQTPFNKRHRAKLLNFLMEMCTRGQKNRETYFTCVTIFDLYVSQVKVTKEEFQLAGLASLLVASKQVDTQALVPIHLEVRPYTKQQILLLEQKISLTISPCFYPQTLSSEFNYIALAWDNYLCDNERASNSLKHPFVYKQNINSVRVYHTAYQFLNLATLDVKTLAFSPFWCAFAALYLAVGLHSGVIEKSTLKAEARKGGPNVLNASLVLLNVFEQFSQRSYQFPFHQIQQALCHMSRFFVRQFQNSASRVEMPQNYDKFLQKQEYFDDLLRTIKELFDKDI